MLSNIASGLSPSRSLTRLATDLGESATYPAVAEVAGSGRKGGMSREESQIVPIRLSINP